MKLSASLIYNEYSIRKARNLNISEIYAEYVANEVGAPSLRTFCSWIAAGQKYAAAAAAGKLVMCGFLLKLKWIPGSFYILPFISYRRMSYRIVRLPWKSIKAMCRAIRRPDGTFMFLYI